MKFRFNWNIRRTVGLIIGIVVPLLVLPLVIWLLCLAQNYPFDHFWDRFVHNSDQRSKILSLCIIGNLGVFFLFLNRERYDIARGIIAGSALYIPYVLYLKFG